MIISPPLAATEMSSQTIISYLSGDAFREIVCLYGRQVLLKHMKTIDRLAVVIAGVLCLTLFCCSKERLNAYSDSVWTGEYPIQTENGTTGEWEDHTGIMTLYFQHSGLDCIVETGIAGLYAVNRTKYETRWSAETQFALYSSAGGQSLLCYSGTINGGLLSLQALNCDGIAATYTLSRMPLQE